MHSKTRRTGLGDRFTFLRCGEGWVYLCAICDGHLCRVLGYCIGPRQDTQLVMTAIDKAQGLRGELPGQVVLHADCGTQFTSHQLHEVAVAAGGRMSIGKTGVCWDNAKAESFSATLKTEYFYQHTFATRAAVYDGSVNGSRSSTIAIVVTQPSGTSALRPINLILNQPTTALKVT